MNELLGWIKPVDRLPSADDTVLVCVSGEVGIGGYSAQFGWWLTGADFEDEPVDYWMPLPKAPNANVTGLAPAQEVEK